jgi:hypothetical protein
MTRQLAALDRPPDAGAVELDAETRAALRSLGYLSAESR